MKRTSRICSGMSGNPLTENLTPASFAGRRITLAKSKKLWRDVKWLGRRMILHSRYWTWLYGIPSAYLPALMSGTRRARPIRSEALEPCTSLLFVILFVLGTATPFLFTPRLARLGIRVETDRRVAVASEARHPWRSSFR